jgi:rfaE bifunctional protein kinase chain/domain/rfaE bifunctional protein nucleotidyltransferase chain/domain
MTDLGVSQDVLWRMARARPNVVVVGDAILDAWLAGECHRLCREAPAPVLDVSGQHVAPGGAANTAVNLAALGARVTLLAATGNDRDGSLLRAALTESGVDTSELAEVPGRTTMTKRRVVAGTQLLVRVDDGDQGPLAEPAAYGLRRALTGVVARADAVVVCDYGLGLLDDAMIGALQAARADIPILAVDAHELSRFAVLRPDFVTPNLGEAAGLLGVELPPDPTAELARRQYVLYEKTGADTVVVTMDRLGTVLLSRDQPAHRTWADPAPDNQTTGAGDTFMAATCLARTSGLAMATAVELGQAAADVVVHEEGTAVCTLAGLAARFAEFRDAVVSRDQLTVRIRALRLAGRRIVFTNGCFDLLHPGHVASLNQAKRLGDVLVVGVNSDDGVRRLKGAGRPVNAAADRAAVLAALSCVDLVTIFDGDDATDLVAAIRPDVYAKGGDHTLESLPEAAVVRACGGAVRLLDRVPELSSSAVIERIRSTAS